MERLRKGIARHGCDRADETVLLRNWVKSNPLAAACAIAGGLFTAYHAGIAIVDAFEWLMHVGTVLGANPFGWSL